MLLASVPRIEDQIEFPKWIHSANYCKSQLLSCWKTHKLHSVWPIAEPSHLYASSWHLTAHHWTLMTELGQAIRLPQVSCFPLGCATTAYQAYSQSCWRENPSCPSICSVASLSHSSLGRKPADCHWSFWWVLYQSWCRWDASWTHSRICGYLKRRALRSQLCLHTALFGS